MPTKQAPLQIVKQKFGSKQELAKKLSEVLEPEEDESREELYERLALVANAKLLHLHELSEAVEGYGGREGLVSKIAAFENKTKDEDYIKALTAKRSLGELVDRVRTHERKAKTKQAKASA